MPFQFTPSDSIPYDPSATGSLFLGTSETGRPVGIVTERHAITIAGAGAGKGAALIIPNLKRWRFSTLVVDPKGENAEQTWQDREAMGQTVHVIDPFRVANVPDRLRARFNPLAAIDPASLTAREDATVIADGLVIRHKADDGEWYDGAVAVLAGFIAHAVTNYGPASRNLATVRDMLNASGDSWQALLAEMTANPACGGLAQTAASMLADDAKSAREFLSGARRSIDKFGTDALRATMGDSSFDLSDLKGGRSTVFLVLPPHYLGEHARFLRLFVRCALDVMAKGGNRTGGRCLFILDEFYALGRINEIATAAGLMRSYGVQLWPFLQDLGQLHTLYGQEGAQTFFGNADARIFFGNTDMLTLSKISEWLGRLTPNEVTTDIPMAPAMWGGSGAIFQAMDAQARLQHDRNQATYQHQMRQAGSPRLTPQEVAALVGKGVGDQVARSMIVFGQRGEVFNPRLAPYFQGRAAGAGGGENPHPFKKAAVPPPPLLANRRALALLAGVGSVALAAVWAPDGIDPLWFYSYWFICGAGLGFTAPDWLPKKTSG